MKRLLLDQRLPRSTGALLSQREWDVIHVSETGMSRADDTEVLLRARADSYDDEVDACSGALEMLNPQ